MGEIANEFALRAFRDALVPGDPSAVVQLLVELEIPEHLEVVTGTLSQVEDLLSSTRAGNRIANRKPMKLPSNLSRSIRTQWLAKATRDYALRKASRY